MNIFSFNEKGQIQKWIYLDVQKLANTNKKTNIRPGISKYKNKYKYVSHTVQLCLRLYSTSLANKCNKYKSTDFNAYFLTLI